MNLENRKVVYREAQQKWGKLSQMMVAMEELAELIIALVKINRKVNGVNVESLADEIADAEIMIEQIRVAYEDKNIDAMISKVKKYKIERLLIRLNDCDKA